MNRFVLLLVLAGTLSLLSCNGNDRHTAPSSSGPNASLARLFDRYWEERLQLFPLEATQSGDARYNDRLTIPFTDSFRDTLRGFYQRYLDSMNRYSPTNLAPNDRLSWSIFRYEMETQLGMLGYPENLVPFNQFFSFPLDLGLLGSGEGSQPFKTEEDYRNWIRRAGAFSAWADSAIVYFRRGLDSGIVLPRALVAKMVPQMRSLAKRDTARNVFWGPLKRLPASLSEAQRTTLRQELTATLEERLLPAYDRLATFLERDYLPRARTSSGLAGQPRGEARYAAYAAYWTTTKLSPDSIYAIGLAEVARIRGEIERIRDSLGFQGTLPAFFESLRNDPKLMPFKTAEEVLQAFRSIQSTIDPRLDRLFGRTPRTPFEIRQTEAFRAASASAEYQQGTADGKRPGIFYVPILDARTFNITSGMESLFLHEAIPGHHYQISLQQENEGLPRFRRYAWYGAFGEGWALYCESLGKELGLYSDPYQYLGALGDEIHRAIRLVVDVGIHTRGMSREAAIQYMMENEAISKEGAVAEIERYMAIPGQALSYKIGALRIAALRAKYEKELGAKFSLASFHDELLRDGVMPLAVLEEKMEAWAKKQ